MNAVLQKEAAYFGDIEILPFMDRYELVVLKTVAICEFGVCYFSLSNAFIQSLDMNTHSSCSKQIVPFSNLHLHFIIGTKCNSSIYYEM